MKQHIDIEQLNELTDKGKEKLYDIAHDKEWLEYGDYEDRSWLPNMGQMIEFLCESNEPTITITEGLWKLNVESTTYEDYDELSDALFEAVKEILNNDS